MLYYVGFLCIRVADFAVFLSIYSCHLDNLYGLKNINQIQYQYYIQCSVVLGRTQFVGSEFGIFGGFGWVCSSVLVGELGFGRVQSLSSRVRSSSK